MTLFDIAALTAVAIVAVLFLLLLFEPNLPYRATASTMPIASREYVNYLSAIVNARLFSVSDLAVLSSGVVGYDAALDAISTGARTDHHRGEVLGPRAAPGATSRPW